MTTAQQAEPAIDLARERVLRCAWRSIRRYSPIEGSARKAGRTRRQVAKHIGKVFGEFNSDSSAMIVLEGDQPLAASAHEYYNTLIRKLSQDTAHVQHIQDFWGDPLTAASSQSSDGKAAYVQVYLAGNQGETLSNESVLAVRNTIAHTPPPPAVKAYVTGATPLANRQIAPFPRGAVALKTIWAVVHATETTRLSVWDGGGDPVLHRLMLGARSVCIRFFLRASRFNDSRTAR